MEFNLKPLTDITLLDVYRAVEVVEEGELFQMHEDTNINCVVGANIQSVLEIVLLRAQDAMDVSQCYYGYCVRHCTTKRIKSIRYT